MYIAKIVIRILMPFLILFLSFSTMMGYIAETIYPAYHLKWFAIVYMIAAYILQFFRPAVGLAMLVSGGVVWFLI
ncbi:hypothetical protein [Jeotgalibacillus salarius]|uniref:Uncharacterized protein n=1 Tax=Jeotgalibacillus salarius TaxID=546023 RepID=A0A4Y8LDL2_9BACL|nr:hypothetical protein [Jeotgalibacillus salarius]TFE00552.1 hypothetical protein E2626_11280 [Jeotgalibacillus salarius]